MVPICLFFNLSWCQLAFSSTRSGAKYVAWQGIEEILSPQEGATTSTSLLYVSFLILCLTVYQQNVYIFSSLRSGPCVYSTVFTVQGAEYGLTNSSDPKKYFPGGQHTHAIYSLILKDYENLATFR